MNRAADALEAAVQAAVQAAHRRAAWPTWIVAGSALYLLARFLPWALAGFPVVGR